MAYELILKIFTVVYVFPYELSLLQTIGVSLNMHYISHSVNEAVKEAISVQFQVHEVSLKYEPALYPTSKIRRCIFYWKI